MAHKTLISGTGYDVSGGRELIGGTGYAKKKGRVLVNGTGYDIPFSIGIPLSTVALGDILMLNENGSPVPFYVCKHDYESGLNGAGRTLLVRKDCYDMRIFGYSNTYSGGSLDKWTSETYVALLDAGVRTEMEKTTFYSNETTIQRAAFQLSATEYGFSSGIYAVEGTALPIASTLRIAYRNGSAATQWTRTGRGAGYVCIIGWDGSLNVNGNYQEHYGSRPAFTLPATFPVIQNPDGTYSPAA